jgi:D-arabinose 1-dehydrogenase-like Zn-dependent alcohol dehydrogenase
MYGTHDTGFFGYSHFMGGFASRQAEYMRVPFGEVNCLVVLDEVKDKQALYLSDVLPTLYHAVVDTGMRKGNVTGVWVRFGYASSIFLKTSVMMSLPRDNVIVKVTGIMICG